MKQLRKIKPKYLFCSALTVVILCTLTWKTKAGNIEKLRFHNTLTILQDTPRKKPVVLDSVNKIVITSSDTSLQHQGNQVQKQVTDTFTLKISKDTLSAPVKYEAEDSAVVHIESGKIILYGKSKIDYEEISMKAPIISMDQQSSLLTAFSKKDSLGTVIETAYFKQGENEFTYDTISYNFKTQKGLSKNTYSQQGEFLVIAGTAKKIDSTTTFVKDGRFTTCLLDEPHFAFRTRKMKMINKKVAVTGPSLIEFEGVPLPPPVMIPFGFFPLSQGRRSGLLTPQFETNDAWGVGLADMGYYKTFGDYWDLETRVGVYSLGTWSLRMRPSYRKRYRYSGGLTFNYLNSKQNFKGDPDYVNVKDFRVQWSHSVDSRARPGTSFSANVDAGTTTYNQQIRNDPRANFQNLLGSSINYSKNWKDKPYSLVLSANHSQNSQNRSVSVTLPNASFTVNTVYPFQKKEITGPQKWYEKLGIGYNGSFNNQIYFYDSAFSFKRILDTMRWSSQHNVPITVALPPILKGAVVVSPGISYSQQWIQKKIIREWNIADQKLDTSYQRGLFIAQNTQFSLGFNTALFGRFNFKNPSSNIKALRHVVRPSVSFNYKPDLAKQFFKTDTISPGRLGKLGVFDGYGSVSSGEAAGFSFQLDNTLEMKVKNKDTTGDVKDKKLRLIDGLGFNFSYNFLADSLNLSNINLYFRTLLFDKINLSANGSLNPYQTDAQGYSINKYAWNDGSFSVGKLTSAQISISTNFESKAKDAKKEELRKKQVEENLDDPLLRDDQHRLLEYARQNPAEFVDFNIPWSLNLSLTVSYSQRKIAGKYVKTITSSSIFGGSFNLTEKWKLSVNGAYDLSTQQLQSLQMSISRDMHCWQMAINVNPVGPWRFFNFTISPKASILQDLKINRSRTFSN